MKQIDMATFSFRENNPKTKLTFNSYRIGNVAFDAPIMNLHFAVNEQNKTIQGSNEILTSLYPANEVYSKIEGKFSYMNYHIDELNVIVIATGHNTQQNNQRENFKLKLILDSEWTEGIARIQYLFRGKWNKMLDVPVRLLH